MTDAPDPVACTIAICKEGWSKNPVAWFTLHQEGLTREAMAEQVADGQWIGPPPRFEDAPPYDGGMWRHMMAAAKEKDER